MSRPNDTRNEAGGFPFGRRQFAILAGFVATVVLSELALRLTPYRVFIPHVHAANQVRLLAHALRTEPVDVLVIGSSRVLEGIDANVVTKVMRSNPATAGEATKIPVQGMRAWSLEQLVEQFVEPSPPTELLVIGLEERFFFVPPFEADTTLDIRMLGDPEDLLDVDLLEAGWPQVRELGLTSLRGVQAPFGALRIFDPRVPEYVKMLQDSRGQPAEDFKPLSRTDFLRARGLGAKIRERAKTYEGKALRPFELHAFERTLERMQALPCKVAFVRMPVLETFDADQAVELALFHEVVVPLAREAGFPFFDMNTEPELRLPELYDNPSHLNQAGRQRASLWLGLNVVKPGLLYEGELGRGKPVPDQTKSD